MLLNEDARATQHRRVMGQTFFTENEKETNGFLFKTVWIERI